MCSKAMESNCFCHLSHLQSFAKAAEMDCALAWMALMVSLLLPAPAPHRASPVRRPSLALEAALACCCCCCWICLACSAGETGLDCSMMVHSASCTRLSSRSQYATGSTHARLEELKEEMGILRSFLSDATILHKIMLFKLTIGVMCVDNDNNPIFSGAEERIEVVIF